MPPRSARLRFDASCSGMPFKNSRRKPPGPLIYASNFASLKKLAAATVEPVAISIGIPRWFRGRRILTVAPTRAMLKMEWDDYDPLFFDILYKLNPHEFLAELGTNVAMLCWCGAGECCHRRYVAEWLETNTGIIVPEYGRPREAIETFLEWK